MKVKVFLASLALSACAETDPSFIEVYLGGNDISGIDETAEPLPSTTDSFGPYVLTAVAKEGRPLKQVDLIECDSAEACVFQAQRDCNEPVEGRCRQMTELTEGIFRAEIPGRLPGSTVFFVLRATSRGGFIDFFPEIRNGEGLPAAFEVVELSPPP